MNHPPLFSVYRLLSRLPSTPQHTHRLLNTSEKNNQMFTYDGIRSQVEWFSTLNIATAPVPTPETKFLRKVRPQP